MKNLEACRTQFYFEYDLLRTTYIFSKISNTSLLTLIYFIVRLSNSKIIDQSRRKWISS